MAFEYYNMPEVLRSVIKAISYAFTGLLTLEIGMKMAAMGWKRCVGDKWTRLDIFIIFASLIEIFAEDWYSKFIPINPAIFRLLRLVRVARVFRLLKTAKGVRKLLDTVSEALPKVAHLSLVFLLLFFIYASLGVELFGKFTCPYAKCYGLSRHASFENFGIAFLTLFRVFTGDKWNGILKDMLHVSEDDHYCRKLLDQNQYPEIGSECSVAGYLSPFFFVSFVLTSRFILINVMTAVLMGALSKMTQKEEQDENAEKNNSSKVQKVSVKKFKRNKPPPNSVSF